MENAILTTRTEVRRRLLAAQLEVHECETALRVIDRIHGAPKSDDFGLESSVDPSLVYPVTASDTFTGARAHVPEIGGALFNQADDASPAVVEDEARAPRSARARARGRRHDPVPRQSSDTDEETALETAPEISEEPSEEAPTTPSNPTALVAAIRRIGRFAYVDQVRRSLLRNGIDGGPKLGGELIALVKTGELVRVRYNNSSRCTAYGLRQWVDRDKETDRTAIANPDHIPDGYTINPETAVFIFD
jgi:hypothetical protein